SPSLIRRPPTPTLFPYTTLFRSGFGTTIRITETSRSPPRQLLQEQPARARRSRRQPRSAPISSTSSVTRSAPICISALMFASTRSEEHTSELQSLRHLVCRLLLE